MSTVKEIIESLVKYGGIAQLTKFLKSCDETRAFSNDNEETAAVIAYTNRLLNETSSRREGLLVLKCLLGQLPSELLQANLLSWIQQAVKGLSQKEYSTVVLAAEVTCCLLGLSSKFADCRKEISLSLVSKIFDILYDLKNSEELLNVVLSTLSVLLKYYSKSGASWKNKFEKFLVTLIESDDETVFLASRCYLGLAACGPPGTDLVNYKENWVGQFNSVSTSLHLILDKIFDNVNEIEQFSRGRIKWKLGFQLPQVNERIPFLKMSRLTQQFSSFCQFLEVLLLGQFPAGKRVTPELLLSVACRGLAVSPQTLQAHQTSDTPSLSAVLPQLHSFCLKILIALIKSCRTNLITYGPMICKLLSQVLKSTEIRQSTTYGQNKPYRSVRILAYECLTVWLSVANCSSNVEKQPAIVDYLISDIQFKKPTVTLNLSSKMLKGKMGKKQRQALVNQTVNNRDEHVSDKEANKDVCCAALRVVPALLDSASSLLPPQAHKDLQSAITSELLLTQLNSPEYVPLPYSDKTCRLGLYQSFVATCLNYHPDFPPPVSFASQLISSGLRDPCHEIVQFCALSSSVLEKILRPIGPTLSLPVELPEAFSGLLKVSSVRKESVRDVFSEQNGKFSNARTASPNASEALPEPASNRSPVQPEFNPLLVDPEMSEFDFLTSGKEVATDDEPNGNGVAVKESNEESPAEPEEPESDTSRTELILQNGESVPSKRKPSPEPEESPISKRPKSSVTEVPPMADHEGGIKLAVAVDPVVEASSDSSVPQTEVERTKPISAPENELEEEMLSSFVDVVD